MFILSFLFRLRSFAWGGRILLFRTVLNSLFSCLELPVKALGKSIGREEDIASKWNWVAIRKIETRWCIWSTIHVRWIESVSNRNILDNSFEPDTSDPLHVCACWHCEKNTSKQLPAGWCCLESIPLYSSRTFWMTSCRSNLKCDWLRNKKREMTWSQSILMFRC